MCIDQLCAAFRSILNDAGNKKKKLKLRNVLLQREKQFHSLDSYLPSISDLLSLWTSTACLQRLLLLRGLDHSRSLQAGSRHGRHLQAETINVWLSDAFNTSGSRLETKALTLENSVFTLMLFLGLQLVSKENRQALINSQSLTFRIGRSKV